MHSSQILEIKRSNDNTYPLDLVRNTYDKFGLVVLKQYVDPNTESEIRSIMNSTCDYAIENNLLRKTSFSKLIPTFQQFYGDILCIRALEKFNYIFATNELSSIFKHLLKSEKIFYYGDSQFHRGAGPDGLHKDNVSRQNSLHSDWDGDYGVLRCAFYCEDHFDFSGGLKVRLKSHLLENTVDLDDKTKISCARGKLVDVRSRFGDLVIWNMRLTHAGNFRLLKFYKNLALHPKYHRKKIEKFIFTPYERQRIGLFFAVAKQSIDFENYLNSLFYKNSCSSYRKIDQSKSILNSAGFDFLASKDYGQNEARYQ